ncbi:MAG: pyridoxamine 5'-phosphate oxidase family protein [bacterium]|nr:pyridoxamine 5'-phosphate oxidase family protein [bacterium]
MATVDEDGWPYLQFRGGPVGFLKVLDEQTLAYADFRGNLQDISTGNLTQDDRVSLFFMDYPNRQRLKLLARAAFDWNCPQHITPRFTESVMNCRGTVPTDSGGGTRWAAARSCSSRSCHRPRLEQRVSPSARRPIPATQRCRG